MATVFVIGATRATGLRVARRLVDRGDRVRGLHRRAEQAQGLRDLGMEPVQGDLAAITPEQFVERLGGADAVVYAAGSSENGSDEESDAIDGRGVRLAVQAATATGVRRFLHVSAFPEAGRGRTLSPAFEHYMRVKKQADVCVAASTLDWVILRPGTLTDAEGRSLVRIGMAIPYGPVSRDDVAATLVELVHAPRIRRVILEITEGADPIAEALEAAVSAG